MVDCAKMIIIIPFFTKLHQQRYHGTWKELENTISPLAGTSISENVLKNPNEFPLAIQCWVLNLLIFLSPLSDISCVPCRNILISSWW